MADERRDHPPDSDSTDAQVRASRQQAVGLGAEDLARLREISERLAGREGEIADRFLDRLGAIHELTIHLEIDERRAAVREAVIRHLQTLGGEGSEAGMTDTPLWMPRSQDGGFRHTFQLVALAILFDLVADTLESAGDLDAAGQLAALRSLRRAQALLADETLRAAQSQLTDLIPLDEVSGTLNRHHLLETLEAELHRAQRHDRPFTLLHLDLDGFTALNERHGEAMGDHVLRETGGVLHAALRDSDVIGRLEGDSFLLGLTECTLSQGLIVARRIARSIRDLNPQLGDHVVNLHASVGVVGITDKEGSLEDLLDQAQEALATAQDEPEGKRIWGR